VLEESFDIEGPDHALVLNCVDHEKILLERPLKAQGLAMEDIIELTSCRSCHKEVYASMD
jgi:hypothetical protein